MLLKLIFNYLISSEEKYKMLWCILIPPTLMLRMSSRQTSTVLWIHKMKSLWGTWEGKTVDFVSIGEDSTRMSQICVMWGSFSWTDPGTRTENFQILKKLEEQNLPIFNLNLFLVRPVKFSYKHCLLHQSVILILISSNKHKLFSNINNKPC